MNAIMLAVISVSVIGLLSAGMLAVASKVMSVPVDERFTNIREALPGANCGACGYAGCDAYAQAMVDDPAVKSNLCIPGGAEVSKRISETLGVAFEAVEVRKAVLHCGGNCEKTSDKMEYHGIQTCKAAKLCYGGKGQCGYGCMGLGDCVSVCPAGAIDVHLGIARINRELCQGCGICAAVCPSQAIRMLPEKGRVVVSCSSKDRGVKARRYCSAGCIACKKCEKVCSAGAITVNDNLATIDYDKCTACGECVAECPVGCIIKI